MAGFLFLFAFFPYVKAIVKGNASPKKATWLIWALNDIIVVAGMAAEGRFNGLIAGATIGATTVFFLSLRKGESGWKPLDIVCVCMSIVAIVASFLVDVNIGIALGLSSLFIAAVPTYVSAWEKPQNENTKAWVIFNIANVFGVIASTKDATFASMAPPIAFVCIDVPMLYLLLVRPAFSLKK